MRRRDRGGLLAGLDEPLGGEQPDGLQQPVPQGRRGGLGHHQALVHQRPEQAGDIQHVQVSGPAHRLGGIQAEAAGEHRQARQQQLLGAGQQRIRPVDGGPQRLLAFQRGAAAPRQQPEPLIQAGGQLTERHRPQAGRGQLDRQRHAVQPPADRHHHRAGLLVHGQGDAAGPGPVREQRHRIGRPGRRGTGLAGSGQRQRWHPVNGLPADAERLAAGGQQMHSRAAPPDRLRGLGAAADQVLAVVHHDQHILQRQRIQQRLQGGPASAPAPLRSARPPLPRLPPPPPYFSLSQLSSAERPTVYCEQCSLTNKKNNLILLLSSPPPYLPGPCGPPNLPSWPPPAATSLTSRCCLSCPPAAPPPPARPGPPRGVAGAKLSRGSRHAPPPRPHHSGIRTS